MTFMFLNGLVCYFYRDSYLRNTEKRANKGKLGINKVVILARSFSSKLSLKKPFISIKKGLYEAKIHCLA